MNRVGNILEGLSKVRSEKVVESDIRDRKCDEGVYVVDSSKGGSFKFIQDFVYGELSDMEGHFTPEQLKKITDLGWVKKNLLVIPKGTKAKYVGYTEDDGLEVEFKGITTLFFRDTGDMEIQSI